MCGVRRLVATGLLLALVGSGSAAAAEPDLSLDDAPCYSFLADGEDQPKDDRPGRS